MGGSFWVQFSLVVPWNSMLSATYPEFLNRSGLRCASARSAESCEVDAWVHDLIVNQRRCINSCAYPGKLEKEMRERSIKAFLMEASEIFWNWRQVNHEPTRSQARLKEKTLLLNVWSTITMFAAAPNSAFAPWFAYWYLAYGRNYESITDEIRRQRLEWRHKRLANTATEEVHPRI